ncbi:NmrA domain-containing protein [Mycena chlorophos]|uniref:NmrA domain-containing protein n=1 Tax=Mycena chlorophos TaxID=658473 RepID=A0A8H6VZN7_MYCCL|nr:NmrA domain-containing protein [Mycena chlorophos]
MSLSTLMKTVGNQAVNAVSRAVELVAGSTSVDPPSETGTTPSIRGAAVHTQQELNQGKMLQPAAQAPAATEARPAKNTGGSRARVPPTTGMSASTAPTPSLVPTAPRSAPTRAEIETLQSQLLQQQAELQSLRTTNQSLRSANDQLESQLKQAIAVSSASSPAFSPTASGASIGDIRRMLDDVSAEIYHLAAALADSSTHPPPSYLEAQEDLSQYTAHVVRTLLPPQIHHLYRSRAVVPDVVNQMALQHVLVAWCQRRVSGWIFGRGEPLFEGCLDETFMLLRMTEDPGDACRWRALTRKHVETEQDRTKTLRWRQDDLSMCIQASVSFFNPSLVQLVPGLVGKRIVAICEATKRLHDAVGTKVVSDDLQITYIVPGTPFNPQRMEDSWATAGKRQREVDEVVCTTTLGLVKMVPRSRHEVLIIVKPQVFLLSDLEELRRSQ